MQAENESCSCEVNQKCYEEDYMKSLGQIGPHPQVLDLERDDVNGLGMFECRECNTYTRDKDHFAVVSCAPNCANCKALRESHDKKPAAPLNGSCNSILYTCPNDGNRWWQSNTYYHLWQQVTDPEEWKILVREGYGRPRSFHADDEMW